LLGCVELRKTKLKKREVEKKKKNRVLSFLFGCVEENTKSELIMGGPTKKHF